MEDISYQVKLPVYEGPLDLLIHLININEIDIYDIPIAQITNEYLEYINIMKELNLEVASEFILMASTLIYIKSKTLLPRPPLELLDEEELDPRAELVDLLLEHQKFKQTAELLKERIKERDMVWTRSAKEHAEDAKESMVSEANLFDLLTALKKILDQAKKTEPITFKKKDFSLEEKIDELLKLLDEEKKLSFSSFFLKLSSKLEIIVYFLAVLEIVRRSVVKVYQKKPLGDIIIVPLGSPQEKEE